MRRLELWVGWALLTVPLSAAAEVGWRPSFAAAQTEARASHRALFVEFTVPGCVACARLERETYPDPAIAALLRQFVPVKVDFTADEALAAQYEVNSSPDLFVMTADGAVLNRISRFVAPKDLRTFLEAGVQAPELRPGPHIAWQVSYEEAAAQAKKLGRPLLIYVWNYG